jgi:hypothetical protein
LNNVLKRTLTANSVQYEGCLRGPEANAAIRVRAKNRASIEQIVRETEQSRGLGRKTLRSQIDFTSRLTSGRRGVDNKIGGVTR